MRVLIVGGTAFTGPHIVRELLARGHRVTVFHRGQTSGHLPDSVEHIIGDRRDLLSFRPAFEALAFDVVVDNIAFTRDDAQTSMQVFRGITQRIVVSSSIDVYRAYGRLHGTEPGPPDPVPLAEDAPLRERLSIHGEEYEKRFVEAEVLGDATLPATVLRLPAIYGPGDTRPFTYLKRMDDGRPTILLDRARATWRFSRGTVRNVAAAVVLATVSSKAAGRIYNVADEPVLSERAWIELVAMAADWHGRVVEVEAEQLPPHLQTTPNWTQDWIVDTGRIREELGYQEVEPPPAAMEAAVAWLRLHPPADVDLHGYDYAAEDIAAARLRHE